MGGKGSNKNDTIREILRGLHEHGHERENLAGACFVFLPFWSFLLMPMLMLNLAIGQILAKVAQLVEYTPEKRGVVGSILTLGSFFREEEKTLIMLHASCISMISPSTNGLQEGKMSFSFENLDTYKKALSLADQIEGLCTRLKGKASYSFLDQLSRASMSVPLNLAEGNGRWHKNEKKQFFWIARGSVFEVVPIIQMARNRGHISEDEHLRFYSELEELSKMLLGLINSVDKLDLQSIRK